MSRLRIASLPLVVASITCVGDPGVLANDDRAILDQEEARTDPAACHPGETAVVVDTIAHRLTLCEGGRPAASFPVALGSGGVDKRRRGDNKTPLGVYALGAPRASQDFHLFVPLVYPTAAQARLGYTGSAVGLHGPPRRFAGLLAILVPIPLPDWTAGCIAVRTDEEIDRIATWLRARAAPHIRLEPAGAARGPR